MSTRVILLEKLAKMISEGVDLDNVQALPLQINKRVTFNYNGNEFGVVIEKIGSENINIFPKILSPPLNLKGYYNFGFDFETTTIRIEKKSYRELAVPLAIIVKSLLEWIEKNNPIFISIFADSKDVEELNKKINLYSALLDREKPKLTNMGYYWDYFNSPKYGKSIYIKKITN
jgi:hypothetical protein